MFIHCFDSNTRNQLKKLGFKEMTNNGKVSIFAMKNKGSFDSLNIDKSKIQVTNKLFF